MSLPSPSSERPPRDRSTLPELSPLSLGEEIREGIYLGLFCAGLLSLWAGVIRLAAGTQPFTELGTSFSGVVLAYVAAGVIGGALFGLLRPLRRHFAGVLVLSILICTVLYGAAGVVVTSPAEWWPMLPLVALIAGAVVGTWMAIYFWFILLRRGRPRRPGETSPPTGR